jgi:hypothetical protein
VLVPGPRLETVAAAEDAREPAVIVVAVVAVAVVVGKVVSPQAEAVCQYVVVEKY